MQNVLIALIVVVLLGGGYYWYAAQQSPSPAGSFGVESMDMTADESGTDTMDAMTPPASAMDTPATGTSVHADASVSTSEVKEFTVTGSNFKFSPATMTVKQGDRVRVTFVNSGGTHDWVIDEFNARTKVIQGGAQETIEFVANKKGSFEYYCSVGEHRQMGMKGTLIVQ